MRSTLIRRHDASRRWLDRVLDGEDTVALTWVALLAFLRLAAKVGLFPVPPTPSEAMLQVEDWIAAPAAQLVQPGNGHARVLT